MNKEEKAFVETTGYFVIQQIVKELYCHFHWIQQTVDDELKHIIQISGKKLQQRHELYIYIHLFIPILYI